MAPARTGRDYPRDDVAALGQAIDRADGFVVLTGEYNHDADTSRLAPLEPKLELIIDDLLWRTEALTPARERDEA